MRVEVYSPNISRMLSESGDDPVRDALRKYMDYFIVNASGNNAVAIDNKIEQAMDLVKSHLMFAVREEVEVLKEKIAELMERISHLEVENNLLRSNATPETLMQLNSLPQQVGTTSYQPTFNPSTGTLM